MLQRGALPHFHPHFTSRGLPFKPAGTATPALARVSSVVNLNFPHCAALKLVLSHASVYATWTNDEVVKCTLVCNIKMYCTQLRVCFKKSS